MKEYVLAEIEVIEFEEKDIIQTSLEDGGEGGTVGSGGTGDSSIWSIRKPN